MFERLGRRVFTRRKRVLVVGLCVLLLGGIWGGSVSKRLSSGGYYDPQQRIGPRRLTPSTTCSDVPAFDATVLFIADGDITAPVPSAAITGRTDGATARPQSTAT